MKLSVGWSIQRYLPLLASRVPDLELNDSVLYANSLCQKGRTYRALLVLVELSLDEAQHQWGLAHSGLAEEHQLELAAFVLRGAIGPLRRSSAAGTAAAWSGCHDRFGLDRMRMWMRSSSSEMATDIWFYGRLLQLTPSSAE